MAFQVIMPTFGLTEGEATLIQWYKQVGERVEIDEPLFEAENEKANLDVPAPESGVLLQILVPAGRSVPLQGLVAWIGEPGEQMVANGSEAHSAASIGTTKRATNQSEPNPPQARVTAKGMAAPATVKASPLARRIAHEHGIALEDVRGSGPGGRIVQRDIVALLAGQDQEAEEVSVVSVATGELLPLSNLRRTTAERLAVSARSVVAVPLFLDVDMAEVQRLRERTRAEYMERTGSACSYNALVLRACALALHDHPALNAQWTEAGLRTSSEVNIGLAVDIEEGLLVPVIRQVDTKRVIDIQVEIREGVDLAKKRKLAPSQLAGGTFTVTNLGNWGIESFVPIINPPQSAILAVGRVAERVVVVDGAPAVRPLSTLCLVFDHRVVDGAPAAACLARIKTLLENPYLLM